MSDSEQFNIQSELSLVLPEIISGFFNKIIKSPLHEINTGVRMRII
jgi:hypothetical protein